MNKGISLSSKKKKNNLFNNPTTASVSIRGAVCLTANVSESVKSVDTYDEDLLKTTLAIFTSRLNSNGTPNVRRRCFKKTKIMISSATGRRETSRGKTTAADNPNKLVREQHNTRRVHNAYNTRERRKGVANNNNNNNLSPSPLSSLTYDTTMIYTHAHISPDKKGGKIKFLFFSLHPSRAGVRVRCF